jgi:hemolysin III
MIKGPKPKLRGISHLLAAVAVLPAGLLLCDRALARGSMGSIAVYVIGLFLLFAVSATYHVPNWSPQRRTHLRRLDRSMIYLFVAGSYTPIVAAMGTAVWPWTLHTVWAAAVLGIGAAVFLTKAPRWVTALPYVVLGWGAVVIMPAAYRYFGPELFWVVTIGGILYTIGAVIYAFKKPNPVPSVFGYHEIFHLLVIIGAGLHYAAIWGMLR